jgi:hypothetical protein
MGNAGRIYDSGKMNLRRKKVRPGFSPGRIDVTGPLEVFFDSLKVAFSGWGIGDNGTENSLKDRV